MHSKAFYTSSHFLPLLLLSQQHSGFFLLIILWIRGHINSPQIPAVDKMNTLGTLCARASPSMMDLSESACNSASTQTSFKDNTEYIALYLCLYLYTGWHTVRIVTLSRIWTREEVSRFSSGGTLSKALLFVCSAGPRQEKSKHVNPLSNISSCLIYISVLLSLVLFSFLKLCPVISRSKSMSVPGTVVKELLRRITQIF